MIKIQVCDAITPMMIELEKRTLGFAQEALQVAGAHVAKAARTEMRKMTTDWINWVSRGKYRFAKSSGAITKELGQRISHTTGRIENPSSVANMIDFYLGDKSLTVVVGGAHPRFAPKVFDKGVVVGHKSKQSSVSVKTRAIIHKLNTGEVTSEHPYSRDTAVPNANYVKNRHFMERGYTMAAGAVGESMKKRFADSFLEAANTIDMGCHRAQAGSA